jgi:hypothetical protein
MARDARLVPQRRHLHRRIVQAGGQVDLLSRSLDQRPQETLQCEPGRECTAGNRPTRRGEDQRSRLQATHSRRGGGQFRSSCEQAPIAAHPYFVSTRATSHSRRFNVRDPHLLENRQRRNRAGSRADAVLAELHGIHNYFNMVARGGGQEHRIDSGGHGANHGNESNSSSRGCAPHWKLTFAVFLGLRP